MAFGQLHYVPLDYSDNRTPLRTAEDSTQISLPVWDDFSTSYIYPDSSIWINSENVQIQSGIGIYPPSVNVAAFDGANQFGNPYGSAPTSEGIGDSLVSRFIDLSGADQNSTFLSFYYQKEGRGELPDDNDFLRLLVKNDTNTWVEVWKVSGNDINVQDDFSFFVVPIDNQHYFHEYFQFKFESFGRLAGPFDNWHVDYVYLNDGRNGDVLDLIDHTILSPPTSFFKTYSSVPYDQFIFDPDIYLDSSSIDIQNIENKNTAISASFQLRYQQNNDVIAVIDDTVVVNRAIFLPFQIRTFNSSIPDKAIFEGLSDSLFLTSFYFINTLDDTSIVNLRANDTVSTNFSIYEELSYDDGTAEFTAGINGLGSELAYQFYTPIEDQITGLKIYFPNLNTGSVGNQFIIKVWNKLENNAQSEVYSFSATRQNGSINEFTYYPFPRAVSVSDTFYIGYEQRIEGLFVVGYDKNTSSSDKIYFRTGTLWEPNTDLTGSLMIRPVFGDANSGVITGIDKILNEDVIIYPNPSKEIFRFNKEITPLEIYDISGKQLEKSAVFRSSSVNLRGYPAGIYFIKFLDNGQVKTRKLLLQ